MTDNQADTTALIDAALPRLLVGVEEKLNRGQSNTWSEGDFQHLSNLIFTTTGKRLSVTTLKRAWGRTTQASRPSATTLNILAQFTGKEHWSEFLNAPTVESTTTATGDGNRKVLLLVAAGVAISLLFFFGIAAFADAPASPSIDSDRVTFSVEKVTSGIPNTVIFRYDLGGQVVDSLELQQTWDNSRRILLDPSGKLVTTTYLSPGYFSAKLVADGEIIKTHNIYLPSNDFEVFIKEENDEDFRPLPGNFWQLDNAGFSFLPSSTNSGQATLSGHFQLANLLPKPTISPDSFTFRTTFRMDNSTEKDRCHGLTIILTAAEEAYVFMFGKQGCSGYFGMFLGGQQISGTTTDLSDMAFIVDEWNNLTIKKQGNGLIFNMNDKAQAFELEFPNVGGFGGARFFTQTPLRLRELYFEDGNGRVELLN